MKTIAIFLCLSLQVVMSAQLGENNEHIQLTGIKTTDLIKSDISVSDLLVRLIKYKSYSLNEKEMGEYLIEMFHETGLHIARFGDSNGNFNFAASLLPLSSGKPNLIFITHLDIMYAGDEKRWFHPPFEGKIINDEVWGRGAYDNKCQIVMQFAALRSYILQNNLDDLDVNVTMLLLSCEETQCPGGAKYVVDNYFDELNPWAIIGEGAPGMNAILQTRPENIVFGVGINTKRALWLDLEVEVNSSSHGSVTPKSYSNQVMIDALHRVVSKKRLLHFTDENLLMLSRLGQLEKGPIRTVTASPRLFSWVLYKRLKNQPELFALFSHTITVTNLSSSTAIYNKIPYRTTSMLDCRLLPGMSTKKFIKQLRRELRDERIQIKNKLETPECAPSSIEHRVYQTIETVLKDFYGTNVSVIPIILPNVNDSSWFRSKGIPAYDINPIIYSKQYLNCVHGYDERIPVAVLDQGAQVYERIIKELCQNLKSIEHN